MNLRKNIIRNIALSVQSLLGFNKKDHPAHPDDYEGTRILDYPFERDKKGNIIAKTNYELEAWRRVEKIKEYAINQRDELLKLSIKNYDDAYAGRAPFNQELNDDFRYNNQLVKDLKDRFTLSDKTNFQNYQTVGQICQTQYQNFCSNLKSMGILPVQSSETRYTQMAQSKTSVLLLRTHPVENPRIVVGGQSQKTPN